MFPAALITSCDSLLNGLNCRCCWRSLWSACRWGWFSIFWIKFWTLTPCDCFTAECGNPGMLKSMFSSLIARLNSLCVLNNAMSRFSSGANCSFTVCALELFRSTGSPVPSWVCSTRVFSDMTTCPRTSRVPATSHIPREVKRACVLRDVRDSQGAPSPAEQTWLPTWESWLLSPFTRACSCHEFLTTLTFWALHGNHIVSIPFQTIVKKSDLTDFVLKWAVRTFTHLLLTTCNLLVFLPLFSYPWFLCFFLYFLYLPETTEQFKT